MSRLSSRLSLLLAVGTLLAADIAAPATAPVPSPADSTAARPSIGIALGGGGARGFSHIGVLERLDELRIPIDQVAGCSMGSVVGLLYCLGFTPQEIEHDVLGVDWRRLMTDKPDRRLLTFRRKTDDMQNIWPFELGITGEGVRLQRALMVGHKFNFALRAPDLYTAGYEGFDALPIPFRPVATDLVTGDVVVPDHGNLLRAMRASMAAVGVFPPVEIDGRTLIDGYLRTMLPTTVVRDMGADVVIAVHPGWSPGQTPDDTVWDLPSIVLQANYILTWANTLPDLEAADIPIKVSLPEIPLYDLTQAETAIEAGRRAVDAHLAELRPLALSEADYARWRASVRRRPVSAPRITSIDLVNTSRVDDRTIRSRVTQAVGDTLDIDGLAADLDRIYALGVFESVDYGIEPEAGGARLVIQPVEKPYLPWILHFGASWQVFFQDQPRFQFLTRIDRLELNRFGGELRGEIALGEYFGAGLELYQPLENSRTLFVAPAAFYDNHRSGVYDGTYRLGTYALDEWGGRCDLGLSLGRVGELRAGWWRGRAETEAYVGVPDLPDRSDDVGALRLRLTVDRIDDHALPRRGFGGHLTAWLARPDLGDDLDYGRYWGEVYGAATSDPWIFQFRAQAGGTEGELPYYRAYRLGGLRDLTGAVDGSLVGGAFGMAGAGALYHLAGMRLPYTTQWYLGGWADVGNVWAGPQEMRLDEAELGGALLLVAETALGPLEFGYGYNTRGRGTVYLQGGVHFAQPFAR